MKPKRNPAQSSGRTRNPGAAAAALRISLSACAVLFLSSCAGSRPDPGGTTDCAVLDTLLAGSGLAGPVSIAGHATVDANQFRIRGKILLEARGARDIVFEFTSAVLFGQEREDFVFSLSSDTLRIVDRERGALYEGEDASRFLAESLEADFDVPQALSLAFGGRPPCGELAAIACSAGAGGRVSCEGRRSGKPFEAVFESPGGRLASVEWPVRSGRYGGDRLRVEYEWREAAGRNALTGVVLSLEARGWRCRIEASETGS